ncbi:MAG: VOC family protein [Planctomycetota bacterium]
MSAETVAETPAVETALDPLHHIAIESADVAKTVDWYRAHFRCEIAYQDETWALLKFANVSVAFVTPGDHPPHLGFISPRAKEHGELKPHRDGTQSIYIADPHGNAVELLDPLHIDGTPLTV